MRRQGISVIFIQVFHYVKELSTTSDFSALISGHKITTFF